MYRLSSLFLQPSNIDPGIKNESGYNAYDEGSKLGIWIKRPDGSDARGKVWPGTVTFPDWFNPLTFEWWRNQAQKFHDIVPFDGMCKILGRIQ